MDLLCPQCQALLVKKGNQLACSSCQKQWSIVDGVIKLSRHPSYWGLISAEEMKHFLAEVKTKGWQKAILSSAITRIKEQYSFTDSPSRADGSFYLSLTPQSKVLDLGSGWGSYTFALSPRVAAVVAADSNFDSLSFINLRAQQDKCANISTVQIEPLDYGQIPFADNSFEVVIMNGVLEWVGAYLKKGDPLKIQEQCLKEVFRILKPGGEIWVGIENRFGLRYILGAPDDHLKYYQGAQIAYTTLVPRIVANWITRKKIGQPYRTYTHSLRGYKKLFKKAGFELTEFYFPTDDYRSMSSKIIPLKSAEVSKEIKARLTKSIWLRLLALFGLERALGDSYFIVVRK